MRSKSLLLIMVAFLLAASIFWWLKNRFTEEGLPPEYPRDLTEALRRAGGSPELVTGGIEEVFAFDLHDLGALRRLWAEEGLEGMSLEDGVLTFTVTRPDNLLAWNGDVESWMVSHVEFILETEPSSEPHRVVWQRQEGGPDSWHSLPFFHLFEGGSKVVAVPLEDSPAWRGKVGRMGLRFAFKPHLLPAKVSLSGLRLLRMDLGTRLDRERNIAGIRRAVIANESRSVVHAPAPSRLEADVDLPERCRLDFGCGVWPTNRNKPGGGVTFRVLIEGEDGEEVLLFEKEVDVKSRSEDRRWFDETVNLPAGQGRRGRLVFETRGGEGAFHDALWAHPVLLASDPGQRPVNLVLVSLDTVRADHLGCYGYSRDTSPELDRLASESVLFENAIAQAPETVSSHMTLFTSLYPSVHGVHLTYQGRELRAGISTLAQVLKENGFITAAFTEGGGVSSRLGFGRGFDRYHDGTPDPKRPHKMTGPTFQRALQWLEGNRDKNFFLFIHTYEVHTPYDPPPPFDTKFGPVYAGPLKPPVYGEDLRRRMLKREISFDSPEKDRVVALYDGGIAYIDTFLGALRKKMERLGIWDHTITVVFSDHGEDLLDHLTLGSHGHSLYEELVRVPLVIRLPESMGITPARIPTPLGLIDLAPTLLDLLSLSPPGGMQGRSYLPLVRGQAMEERPVFMEDPTLIERYGVRYKGKKRILSPGLRKNPLFPLFKNHADQLALTRFEGILEEEEEFDLAKDPRETRNLESFATNPVGSDLKSLLETWIHDIENLREEEGVERALDSVTIERLKTLGYLR